MEVEAEEEGVEERLLRAFSLALAAKLFDNARCTTITPPQSVRVKRLEKLQVRRINGVRVRVRDADPTYRRSFRHTKGTRPRRGTLIYHASKESKD